MKRSLKIVALVSLLALLSGHASAQPQNDQWFVGFWQMTADEDGTPSDTMEFRTDGTYVNHGYKCGASTAKYHLHGRDIYVTVEVEGKGPIAIIFRPSSDKKKLIYTSPRTRKNATYERLQNNPYRSS